MPAPRDNMLFSPLFDWTKAVKRIKFGGVVGKFMFCGTAAVCVLGVMSFWASPGGVLILGTLGSVVFLACLGVAAAFAFKHPVEATLEGAEMVAFHQQAMAIKGQDVPKASPVVSNDEPLAIEAGDQAEDSE